MAPGIDGLPAAEREVDVSGPVAEFLELGLAAGPDPAQARPAGLRVAALPVALQPPRPRRARRLPAPMEGSRFRLHHELLLMAKIFATLGYAVDPVVEERIGIETSCRARRRHAARAGRRRSARPSPPARARNATWSSSAPAPAAPPRPRPSPRPGLDVIVLEAGDTTTATTTPRTGSRRSRPLPRRRPDDRRRQPADPGAGGEDGRRDDGDQLRDLLPGPDQVLEHWRDEHGVDWARDLDP